ncbi:aspartate/glutamate racemase family protein [Bacillus mexicanus]|uniref:glutamate racemase n=1 Tax=Bacillus mexicanus TaxID=2834415 RepID=UPI003D261EEF
MIVGLIDSGIGGWSFLTKIKKHFPDHTYLYFADQKNSPYGNKSVEELRKIAMDWIKVLKEQKLDILIIACNTLTAWFRDQFREELNIPVLGTTDGLVSRDFQGINTILLATVKTVQSKWYQNLFSNIESAVGNTWLAAAIEKDYVISQNDIIKLKNEVEREAGFDWDAMILGCTHYPLIIEQLKEIWPEKTFVDPAEAIIEKLKNILDNSFLVNHKFVMYTTGNIETFNKQIEAYFSIEIRKKMKVDKININNDKHERGHSIEIFKCVERKRRIGKKTE